MNSAITLEDLFRSCFLEGITKLDGSVLGFSKTIKVSRMMVVRFLYGQHSLPLEKTDEFFQDRNLTSLDLIKNTVRILI